MKKFFIFALLFSNAFYPNNSESTGNILCILKKGKKEEYRKRHNLKISIIEKISHTADALQTPILGHLLKKK